MRPIVNLNTRGTLATIRTSLEKTGRARCAVTELRVDMAEWRALARRAARELGRAVQTVEDDDQVTATLRDWPRDDEERSLTLDRMRKSIEAMQSRSHPRIDP